MRHIKKFEKFNNLDLGKYGDIEIEYNDSEEENNDYYNEYYNEDEDEEIENEHEDSGIEYGRKWGDEDVEIKQQNR